MIVEVRISDRGNVSIYEVENDKATKKLMGAPPMRVLTARMAGRKVRRFHAEHTAIKSTDEAKYPSPPPHAIELGEPVD